MLSSEHEAHLIKNSESSGEKRKALVERAVAFIRESILNGQYLPGERLVETRVAKDANIGIQPVREAMRVLAGQQLLKIEPYRGATVRRFTLQEFMDRIKVIDALMGLAVSLAAERVTETDHAKLISQSLQDLEHAAATSSLLGFLAETTRYSKLIIKISGNEFLDTMLEYLYPSLFDAEVAGAMKANDGKRLLRNYRKLTNALLAGNGSKAQRVYSNHMDEVARIVKAKTEPNDE